MVFAIDPTALTVYGKQQRARVGYNPLKRGRRCYSIFLCFEDHHLRVRGDAAFYSHKFIEPLDERSIGYTFEVQVRPPIIERLQTLSLPKL